MKLNKIIPRLTLFFIISQILACYFVYMGTGAVNTSEALSASCVLLGIVAIILTAISLDD